MHGVFISKGIEDWQIVQHKNGYANLSFEGTYQVPKAAIEVGTKSAVPIIRVMSEDDNSPIIPWTKTHYTPKSDIYSGTWTVALSVPAGGLYRIETGLDAISTQSGLSWLFRGDVRVHVGVGDLFVIAGQSNSSGHGKDSAYDPPETGVHLYRNRQQWDLACHPMNESTFAAHVPNAEIRVCGVSPYLSFGKCLKRISHYPVGLISAAIGGAPISRWDPDQNGDLFRNMIDRIQKCGGIAAGILWYQGCADTFPDIANQYLSCFKNVVKKTREALGYEIPFFTFQLNRQIGGAHDECWGMVRDSQRKASHQVPSVYILPTLHCSLCDHIHNSAHANVMLGEKMAKLCGNILYGTPEFHAPEFLSAHWRANTLCIQFQNVQRGFMVFSENPGDCGFMVEDGHGVIPITSFQTDSNLVTLVLERAPQNETLISFGWEANPTPFPFVDEITYLPPVSFYRIPIQQ